jgi:RsiW-degrading membrane proteinase PrsW (M82 family)
VLVILAILISAVAAALPTLVYTLAFYWADRYEREPLMLLAVAFLWGAVPAIIVSVIAELALGAPLPVFTAGLNTDAAVGVLIAPAVEEIAKALPLLWLFLYRRQEFDGPLDGLIYGALIGFGFAMTEDFFYFMGAWFEDGFIALGCLFIFRTLIFGLNHAFFTSLTGLGFGFARGQPSVYLRATYVLLGLAGAILAHTLHNLGAALMSLTPAAILLSFMTAAGGLAILFITVLLAWRQERTVLRQELTDEVGSLITRQELDLLTGRWRQPILPSRDGSSQRMQLYVELAARKRRLREYGAAREPELPGEIAALRAQLAPAAPPAA